MPLRLRGAEVGHRAEGRPLRKLSREAYERARRFVDAHARPLDRALASHVFDGGAPGTVADALRALQNADGGFGRCIEPDFRLDASSSLGTTVGLQYAYEVGLAPTDPLVESAVRYFLATFDEGETRWHAVPAGVNDVPHAPWWSVDPATGRCGVEGTWANPNAEIVGYLWRSRHMVPGNLLNLLTSHAIAVLEAMPEPMDMHDLLCYQRLTDCLPPAEGARVGERVNRSATGLVGSVSGRWDEYGPSPLMFAPTPASPLATVLAEPLAAQLDREVERAQEDGSWRPTWTWAGAYPEAWAQAEVEWAGAITVKTLKTLSYFGRMA